jgi:hypothetical protein
MPWPASIITVRRAFCLVETVYDENSREAVRKEMNNTDFFSITDILDNFR